MYSNHQQINIWGLGNSKFMKPIFLDGYLVYLSNATGLDAKRILFLAWLFLQNTTRSDFREF
jgi:hypothetical protein